MRFPGKVAIVTGGAGGVGRALVRKLTSEGAAVMVADVSVEGCRSVVEEVGSAGGGAIDSVAGDLRDRVFCERVVAETVERFGGVDILFNNAGIIPRGTILETSDEMWHAAFDVNLNAMFYLCRAAIPAMKVRGGGAIVNTSSVWGVYPGRGTSRTAPARARWPRSRRAWGVITRWTAYCASKAGVHGLTRAMAVDLGADGIRVNAIAPGWIASELSETYLESHPDPEAARDALNRLHPVGRVGRPTDVGDLAVYLASDRSSFLTGEIVVLDGSRTATLPLPS